MYGHYFLMESPGFTSDFNQSILRSYECGSIFQLEVCVLRHCLCDICLLCTNEAIYMSRVAHCCSWFLGKEPRIGILVHLLTKRGRVNPCRWCLFCCIIIHHPLLMPWTICYMYIWIFLFPTLFRKHYKLSCGVCFGFRILD